MPNPISKIGSLNVEAMSIQWKLLPQFRLDLLQNSGWAIVSANIIAILTKVQGAILQL